MFNLITNDQADSLCADCDAPNSEWSPMNWDWQLSLKVDGTYHLYWYLPLSQRVKAIPQWTKNQSAIKEFCGDKPITTVSWADEPLHPINDLSRFYRVVDNEMVVMNQPISDDVLTSKAFYRFLTQAKYVDKLPSGLFDGNCFRFDKSHWNILDQLHDQHSGLDSEINDVSDIIIATLQANNDRTVMVLS